MREPSDEVIARIQDGTAWEFGLAAYGWRKEFTPEQLEGEVLEGIAKRGMRVLFSKHVPRQGSAPPGFYAIAGHPEGGGDADQ